MITTRPCPTHPVDGRQPCEPMQAEPWRCAYGDHLVGRMTDEDFAAGGDALDSILAARSVFQEGLLARQRERRLEAAAEAGLFLRQTTAIGRAELQEWDALTVAAGCTEPIAPTEAGMVFVLKAALGG